MANNVMFTILRLGMFPVACLAGLPYVEQINAQECWRTCIVNLDAISALHGGWCHHPMPRPTSPSTALLDAVKVACYACNQRSDPNTYFVGLSI